MSLDVIDVIASAERPIGVTEVASRLNLSKGAVHTVLTNLEARGYVRRAPASLSFTRGYKVWELGSQVARQINLGELLGAELIELEAASGETVQVASYISPGWGLFVHQVVSRHPVQAYVAIGGRAPATSAATAQLLLAFQDQEEIDKVLALPLPQVTDNSITDPVKLAAELQLIRERGYSMTESTFYRDTISVAVPIRDFSGKVPYAVAIFGPTYRFDATHAHAILPTLNRIALTISRKLGFQGKD
jgi:DNA-binding IclR family transcriptional regulator